MPLKYLFKYPESSTVDVITTDNVVARINIWVTVEIAAIPDGNASP